MTEYEIIVTPQAEDDLKELFSYIAVELLEPNLADKLRGRIRDAVMCLSTLPERNPLWKNEPWRSRNLRFLSVGNFLIMYITKEDDCTVHIIRILYGGRDIDSMI